MPVVIDLPSTHTSPRNGAPILMIVVHATAGTDSRSWLTRNPQGVSAHVLIAKDGTIYRMVPDHLAAHHVGHSRFTWDGRTYHGTSRPNVNQVTLGIELENLNNGRDPYPAQQLDACAWQIKQWQEAYNPPLLRFHRDIDTRGKSDPRGLTMATLEGLLAPLTPLPAPPPPPVTLTPDAPIIGAPSVPATTILRWLDHRAQHLTWQERSSIVCAYTALGELSGCGNLYPFAQGCHETANFSSDRWRRSRNPAGLGATNDGAWGGHFATPAEGIIAQYAHLLAYALPEGEGTPAQQRLIAFDPRLEALEQTHGRGSARRWIDLNGKWAVPGDKYAQAIALLAGRIVTEAP